MSEQLFVSFSALQLAEARLAAYKQAGLEPDPALVALVAAAEKNEQVERQL